MDLKLGAFILSLIGASAIVLFGLIPLDIGENWAAHIKALYLITYTLLLIIILTLLVAIDKKGDKKNEVE